MPKNKLSSKNQIIRNPAQAGKNQLNDSTPLQERIIDLENRLKRALADYQNLEKRSRLQKLDHMAFANESLIGKLLPVVDDLERAQSHLEDSGLQMVIDQFSQVLGSENVTSISAQGLEFDPETMDCIEVVPGKKNIVTKVITKGYLYNEKVIRPAQVGVGSGGKK